MTGVLAVFIFTGLAACYGILRGWDVLEKSYGIYLDRKKVGIPISLRELHADLHQPDHLRLCISAACLFGLISLLGLSLTGVDFPWYSVLLTATAAGFSLAVLLSVLRIGFRNHRKSAFTAQLEGALTAIASALRAGFSINHAISVVAEQDRWPVSDEFKRLLASLRLGTSVEEAFKKMADRVDTAEARITAIAVITAQETGGELSLVLDRLAHVIRQRYIFQSRLEAWTAQGRMEARAIAAMPIVAFALNWLMEPEKTEFFLISPFGVPLLIVSAGMILIGFLVIKNITTIKV